MRLSPRAQADSTIAGELLLALQKESAALLCFREVQQRIAHFLQQRGGIPFIPLPRGAPDAIDARAHSSGTPRTVPNSADNWLIQRFLTLKDHDNALSEFNRMWGMWTDDDVGVSNARQIF